MLSGCWTSKWLLILWSGWLGPINWVEFVGRVDVVVSDAAFKSADVTIIVPVFKCNRISCPIDVVFLQPKSLKQMPHFGADLFASSFGHSPMVSYLSCALQTGPFPPGPYIIRCWSPVRQTKCLFTFNRIEVTSELFRCFFFLIFLCCCPN